MDDQARTPLVEMKDISLAFGGLKAVDDASLDLYPGEVVGLLGHNGAGKSCLIKVLSGAYKRDSGHIFINGEEAVINNPRDAKHYGIERSTRRSGSPTTSTPRRTSISGGSCSRAGERSMTPRWKPKRAR